MNESPGDTALVLGVVIDLPGPLAADLRAVRREHGFAGADGIGEHITLLPPMTMTDDDLPMVIEHLAAVARATEPFTVALDGTDTFRPESPVVYLRVSQGADACARLQKAVHTPPLDHELNYPYHPHVTVAHLLSEELLDAAARVFASTRASFTVTKFTLYRRRPNDPWQVGERFPLLGAPQG